MEKIIWRKLYGENYMEKIKYILITWFIKNVNNYYYLLAFYLLLLYYIVSS